MSHNLVSKNEIYTRTAGAKSPDVSVGDSPIS